MFKPSRSGVVIDVPEYHPLSEEYRLFWLEQLERCRWGYWMDGGTYVPPSLYFYINFCNIRRQSSLYVASSKVFGRPDLRDLEWEFHYLYLVARGFSGFEDDDEYTSFYLVRDNPEEVKLFRDRYPFAFNSRGELKKYVDPYDYLMRHHERPLGRVEMNNDRKNILFLGSRDLGKSYLVAGIISHLFTFDNFPYEGECSSEIVVGASLADKSRDLLRKFKDMIDNFPGFYEAGSVKYPAPFSKQYTGSINVGSDLVAKYRKKVGGRWKDVGSMSIVKHRSFKDNPYAAQGTRPDLLVIEEVGHCPEFKEIYYHTVDAMRRGLFKTGTLIGIGTGGDMDGGTLPVSEMFFSPEAYDFIPFRDKYENKYNSICYFVPATYSLDEYRDSDGFVNHELAKEKVLRVRASKKSASALEQEIQYRPLVPSEMFLSRSTSIFPTAELRRRLGELVSSPPTYMTVDLYFDPSSSYGGVSYRPINGKPLLKFPTDDVDREGSVVIWELPHLVEDGDTGRKYVPNGAYIIGCDPYRDDNPLGPSLAAIYVIKTSKYMSTIGFDEVVASYVGRPYLGKAIVNEILHKLALFYNAKIYFENSVGNVKDYFEKVRRLDLLATQPLTLFNKKAASLSSTLIYGYPMPNHRVKLEALHYLRDWLLTERGDGRKNLDLLPDPALVSELISFTMDGNFDRVMAMVGCVIGLEETFNLLSRRMVSETQSSNLDREFERIFVKNPIFSKYSFNIDIS